MPLDRDPLFSGLRDLFEGKPQFAADEADAADKIATLCADYAANALAGGTAPISASISAAKTKLAQALEAAFTAAKAAGPAGVSALGLALDTAMAAFWLAPPIAFAAPPPPAPPSMIGVVTVAIPAVLAPSLTALFLAGVADKPSATAQADSLATLLHGWTKTVMVVNTPVTPPGPPAPPTPLS